MLKILSQISTNSISLANINKSNSLYYYFIYKYKISNLSILCSPIWTIINLAWLDLRHKAGGDQDRFWYTWLCLTKQDLRPGQWVSVVIPGLKIWCPARSPIKRAFSFNYGWNPFLKLYFGMSRQRVKLCVFVDTTNTIILFNLLSWTMKSPCIKYQFRFEYLIVRFCLKNDNLLTDRYLSILHTDNLLINRCQNQHNLLFNSLNHYSSRFLMKIVTLVFTAQFFWFICFIWFYEKSLETVLPD